MPFIPGLELSRLLYEEQIAPMLRQRYPALRYAAATYGMCSECLGLDDEVSRDHMWGPRVSLVLSPEDHARHADGLRALFRAELPAIFHGHAMTWLRPGVDVQDTREASLYNLGITTLPRTLAFCGGPQALPLSEVAWLKVSEQHLCEFTNGVVYRDDTGELTRARAALAYYPDPVLRFLLMCGWNAVGGDWFPIGRIGSRGDRLGLRLQAARIAQHLMRLGFMVSRRYYTYRKWFGTLFQRLPIAVVLEPVLLRLLAEDDWRMVEERIWEAAAIVLRHQNALGIAPEVALTVSRSTDVRHHLACDYWAIGRATVGDLPPAIKALQANELFWLHDRQQILWNEETGKWLPLLQKDSV